MRVLIVDDHADSATLLAKLLRAYGHTSDTAPTLALAIAAAGLDTFDVALIDLTLPDGSGESLLPLFREKGIKCVAVTGLPPDRLGPHARFDAFISKPIDVRDLALLLEKVK